MTTDDTSRIGWRGPAPRGRLAGILEKASVRTQPFDPNAPEDACIVSTPTPRLPNMPLVAANRWIWICDRALSASVRQDAVLRGAYDVLSLDDADVAVCLSARVAELLTPEPPIPTDHPLVLKSDASRRVAAQLARVAATSMPVLFTGETGTGKEIMARLTHTWSTRRRKPFVPINCAAIPNELMEAELFGYARGAFSGAVQRYDGQLMAAEGGTVFLDEIDETPLETQVKLLRVLDDRVVSRLGENVGHVVDFRLLAATNQDLHALIDAGRFGADLYERLAIVTIPLIPLRERPEDLPELATHFAQRFSREQGSQPVDRLRDDALKALEAYPWPGNVRELRNVMYETLVYKRAGREILLSDLPKRVLQRNASVAAELVTDESRLSSRLARGTLNLRDEVAGLERLALEEALRRTGGNAAQAARLLGEVGRGAARDPGATVRAMMRRLKPSR
jgi:DNA-binding NtrC family response regulator